MRIETITLSWWRGAAEHAVMNIGSKSVVVYGANGSGKSTFPDAIEYLVRNGKIGHLQHEYSGKRLERGVRNTHCPPGVHTAARVQFAGGGSIELELAPAGNPSITSDTEALVKAVQAWEVKQLILRQDEVAAFIHTLKKSEKYSVLLPLLGLEDLEYAAENFHQLQRRVDSLSELARKKQHLQDLSTNATQFLPDLAEEKIAQSLNDLAKTYLEQVPTELPELVKALSSALDAKVMSLEPENKRHLLLTQIHEERLMEKLAALTEAEANAKGQIDALLDRRIAVLEPTSKFVEQLQNIEEEVDCPACGRSIRITELLQHVRGELQVLQQARSARTSVQMGRRSFASPLKQVLKKFGEEDVARWLDLPAQQECKAALSRLAKIDLDHPDEGWSPEESKTFNDDIRTVTSHIKTAIEIAPPTTKQLVEDQRLVRAAASIPEIRTLQIEIAGIQSIIDELAASEALVRDAINTRTKIIVHDISKEVQRLWSKLHPDELIENIHLYVPEDSDKAIDIGLKFFGVDQPSPRLTLSEGHRNSLGLCIFLALVRLDKAQDKPIILDDIVSSLDRDHRAKLVDVLVEDLEGRQVLLFTHEREWFAELRSRLPTATWKFMALRPWESPTRGLQWSESADTFDDARCLVAVNAEAAGNRVRAIMDTSLALAAENLRIPMPYARGDRNDRRTSIEFLERIVSEGRHRLRKRDGGSWPKYLAPIADWQEAHRLLISWANRASHSGSLIGTEAGQLIDVCETALSHFRCRSCGDPIWLADQRRRERVQCSCGEIQWRYGVIGRGTGEFCQLLQVEPNA